MLHTVNKSPFEKNSLKTCLRLALPGSDILLIEDAVYAAMAGTEVSGEVADALSRHKLHALGPDLASRGIDPGSLIEGVEVVDYEGFVDLVANNDKVQSWL